MGDKATGAATAPTIAEIIGWELVDDARPVLVEEYRDRYGRIFYMTGEPTVEHILDWLDECGWELLHATFDRSTGEMVVTVVNWAGNKTKAVTHIGGTLKAALEKVAVEVAFGVRTQSSS